jgi:hypothetical protein
LEDIWPANAKVRYTRGQILSASVEADQGLDFALEHDFSRNPVSTFRDHAPKEIPQ